MARRPERIRLVGGPAKLDGTVCDLRVSQHDRADAHDRRFVRVTDGTTVTALSSLRSGCRDREHAAELASRWRAVVYRAGTWGPRARVYRFTGYHSLEPARDEQGQWSLAIGAICNGSIPEVVTPAPTVWTALERAVDDAAARFAAVAGLVPPGPLAERTRDTQQAVDSCVADARRLCAVGATVAPDAPRADATDHGHALIERITSLVRTIDLATSHVVELHLDVHDVRDPVEPLATLRLGFAELRAVDDRTGRPDRT